MASLLGAGNLSIQNSIIHGFRGSSSGRGVYVNGSNNARVFIENTQIKGNLTGVYVQLQAGATNTILIERPVLDLNSTANLSIFNSGSVVVLTQSTLAGNGTAISNTGGSVISYGNNVIRGAGAPTSTVPRQ